MEIKYKEDLLALPRWLRQVILQHYPHLSEPVRITTHVPLPDGGEADLVLSSRRTRVAVELKDNSTRVFDQAMERLKFFDYAYAAINWPIADLIVYLGVRIHILRSGIGIASTRDDTVLVYSRKNRAARDRFTTVLELVTEGIDQDTYLQG